MLHNVHALNYYPVVIVSRDLFFSELIEISSRMIIFQGFFDIILYSYADHHNDNSRTIVRMMILMEYYFVSIRVLGKYLICMWMTLPPSTPLLSFSIPSFSLPILMSLSPSFTHPTVLTTASLECPPPPPPIPFSSSMLQTDEKLKQMLI